MEQINLNRPELWPQPIPFAARAMAWALAALLVAMTGLYGYQQQLLAQQKSTLVQAEDAREQAQQDLKAAEKAHKDRRAALEDLRQRVADLQRRVALFEQAEATLNKRLAAAGSKGELARALGRARSGMSQVWLTRFLLDGVAPVRVRLEGRSLTPEAIPRYLRAVSQETVFRGGFFQDLTASPAKDEPGPNGERVLQFHSEAAFPIVTGAGQ